MPDFRPDRAKQGISLLPVTGDFSSYRLNASTSRNWGAHKPRLWTGMIQGLVRAVSLISVVGLGIVMIALLLVFAGVLAVSALAVFMTLSVIALVARRPLPIRIKVRAQSNDLHARKDGSSWVVY